MQLQPVRNITRESFGKYGTVIEFTPACSDGWEVVAEAPVNGWRIAVLEFSTKSAKRLENHPTSKESFEPLVGTAILFAAENSAPEKFEAFLLDKPVCLNEGVWHEVISLSEVSQVKITENLTVDSSYYMLPCEAAVQLTY